MESTLLIETPHTLTDSKQRIRSDLELLLSQPGAELRPPCQNCRQHKVDLCNSKCGEAASALSSDPNNFPLEPKVVPLVYELRKTRVIQPCWSCEGHIGHDGKLWKLPQICFYSASPVYATLLVNYLSLLQHKKKLTHEWIIVVSSFSNKANSLTYTIEPKLSPDISIHLGSMQADLIIIADNLAENIKREAMSMLEALN